MIVFVHLYNDRSGSPKVLSQAVKALFDAGYPVEILTSVHSDGFLSDIPGNRREIFYRRCDNKILTLVFYVLSQIYLFFFCFRYWRNESVFHINTMMPFGAAFAAFLMRKRVIYHVHETSIKPNILKMILRFFIKITADHVIYVSHYLKSVDGLKGKHEVVIYNSIDIIPKKINHCFVNKKFSNFKILMVCSLKKYKGIDEFFELARRFSNKSNFLFELVLNADQQKVDSCLKGRELHNVVVYGRQKDLSFFYKEADLLLNMSRPDECVETFGLTIVEAMSYSLPVIVPPVGGPVELITHGVQGFTVSCYDIDKIESYIHQLADDTTLYTRLSNNAYQRAMEFPPCNFEKLIVQFYRDYVF